MSSEPPRREAVFRLIGLGLLLAGGSFYVWWMSRPSEPRGTATKAALPASSSALRHYVGRERCAECHAQQATEHGLSGHSRALTRTKDSPAAMSLCGKTNPAYPGAGDYIYSCDEEGLLATLPDKFGDKPFPIQYAFGSGTHAVTFLTLLPAMEAEQGVIGVEHRRTWYCASGETGITPGQQDWTPEREIEFFGRSFQGEVLRRCISCHTTHARLVGSQLEDLIMGVQCEGCHGPGAEHVRAAEAKETALIRSSIQRVRSPADELELCGSCHRLPRDIDPERLKRYPLSVTRFQPVGLMQSACYLKSNGRLGCLNCHDAHGPVTSRTADDQTNSCRGCHQPGRDPLCSAGHGTECVRCHMRKLELIEGIYFHDHWIRKNPPPADEDGSGRDTSASGEPAAP